MGLDKRELWRHLRKVRCKKRHSILQMIWTGLFRYGCLEYGIIAAYLNLIWWTSTAIRKQQIAYLLSHLRINHPRDKKHTLAQTCCFRSSSIQLMDFKHSRIMSTFHALWDTLNHQYKPVDIKLYRFNRTWEDFKWPRAITRSQGQ